MVGKEKIDDCLSIRNGHLFVEECDTVNLVKKYGDNAAVNLNAQPPIPSYTRVSDEPVNRLSSIDTGRHIEIAQLEELLDYRRPGDGYWFFGTRA